MPGDLLEDCGMELGSDIMGDPRPPPPWPGDCLTCSSLSHKEDIPWAPTMALPPGSWPVGLPETQVPQPRYRVPQPAGRGPAWSLGAGGMLGRLPQEAGS